MSGTFASAGEDCQKGIEAAVQELGLKEKVKSIYADSKNDPTTAISEFRKLTKIDRALAIYTHRSSIGMPLNPISLAAKVPILGAVGHKDYTANPYAFQIWPRSDEEGKFVAQNFFDRGLQRVAMIVTEDEWTSAIAEGFRDKLGGLNLNLVADESVLLNEQDFRTVLLRIKQKSPDVIYLNILLPQIGLAVKQARELGLRVELFSNFYTARAEVRSVAGDSLDGTKYVEMDTNLPSLKKRLGLASEDALQGLTLASYVATYLLAQSANSLRDQATATSLYNSLIKQNQINTPDRTYHVSNRYVEFPLVVREVGGGS